MILMVATKEEWKLIDIVQAEIKHKDIVPNVLAGHTLSGCECVTVLKQFGTPTHLDDMCNLLR